MASKVKTIHPLMYRVQQTKLKQQQFQIVVCYKVYMYMCTYMYFGDVSFSKLCFGIAVA